MPSPPECLVLFDCDGVLVDSERLAVAIDVRVMGTLGWPITEAEAVKAIDAEGFQTCVASSGSTERMRRTLGKTGLWDFFEGRIYSAAQVARGKPEPDLFLYAAEQVGIPPARCVVVEDSRYGVAAARAAGMKVIGFAGGVTPAAQLATADVVLAGMSDLPGMVRRALC